ncbi:MAG: endolytic transglycosylase MltG [Clostridiaceae bacterium]
MKRQNTQAPKKVKKKKKMRLAFWLLVLLICAATTVIFATISYDYVIKNHLEASKNEPVVVDEAEGVEFVIERGASTTQIAKNLMDQGLIKNESIFKLLSKINGYDMTYQSGTHIISKKLSYDDIMRVLSSEPATRMVTIPEGKTFLQAVDILYEKKIIKDKASFIKAANTEEFDYDFLKDLPKRENRLEGYLFPDTYEFDRNVSERQVIAKMLDNFDRKFKAEYRDMISKLKNEMTLDKVVIMASLIEREAKDPDDRYMIAGVLYNRLTSKDKTLRKLQVDATIQYIMLKKTGTYKDRILYADLEIDDPYNTYKYEGLPPGPICCPGEASIKAALNPDVTKNLYYVAKGDGSHEFSETFAQHQAAIKKYGTK